MVKNRCKLIYPIIILILMFSVVTALHTTTVKINGSSSKIWGEVPGTGTYVYNITIWNDATSNCNITNFNFTAMNISSPTELNITYFSNHSDAYPVICEMNAVWNDLSNVECRITNKTKLPPNGNVSFRLDISFAGYNQSFNLSYFDKDNSTVVSPTDFINFSIGVSESYLPVILNGTWNTSYAIPQYNRSMLYGSNNYISDYVNITINITDIGYGMQNVSLNISNESSGVVMQKVLSLIGGTINNGNWSVNFSTSTLMDGIYNFTIMANDSYGNINTSVWEIKIDNTNPVIHSITPSNGTIVNEIVNVIANISDDLSGIISSELGYVQYKIYGVNQGIIHVYKNMSNTTAELFNASLNTSTLSDGQYNISIFVTDHAYNLIENFTTQIIIDNTYPQINSTSLANDSIVSGVWVWLNFSIIDANFNNNTIQYNYGAGWNNISSDDYCSSPETTNSVNCSYQLNTSLMPPTNYDIQLRAYDFIEQIGTNTTYNIIVRRNLNSSFGAVDGNANPGTLNYPVTLHNTGNMKYNVTLEFNQTQSWPISLSASSFTLDINETANLYVSGTLPKSIDIGNSMGIEINATFKRGITDITANVSENTTTFRLTMTSSYNISINAEDDTLWKNFTIPSNDIINITINIENIGNNFSEYAISFENSSTLSVGANHTSFWLNITNDQTGTGEKNTTNRSIIIFVNVSEHYTGNGSVNVTITSNSNNEYNKTIEFTFEYPELNLTYEGPTATSMTSTYYTGTISGADAQLRVIFRVKPTTSNALDWDDINNATTASNCTIQHLGNSVNVNKSLMEYDTNRFYCVFNDDVLDVVNGGYYNITINIKDNHGRSGNFTRIDFVPVPSDDYIIVGNISMAPSTQDVNLDFDLTIGTIKYAGLNTYAGIYGSIKTYYEIMDTDHDNYCGSSDSLYDDNNHLFLDCSIDDDPLDYDAIVNVTGIWGLKGGVNDTNEIKIEESGYTTPGGGDDPVGTTDDNEPTVVPGITVIPSKTRLQFEGGESKNTLRLQIENTMSAGRSVYIFPEMHYTLFDFEHKGRTSISTGGEKEYELNYTLRDYIKPGNYTLTINGMNNMKDIEYFSEDIDIEIKGKTWPTDKVSTRKYIMDTSENFTKVFLAVFNPLTTKKNVTIRETIPKDVAADASLITYDGVAAKVIEADPVIEWTIEVDAGKKAEVSYTVEQYEDKGDIAASQEEITEIIDLETGESVSVTGASCGDVVCPEGYNLDTNCECVFACLDVFCEEGEELDLTDCTCKAIAGGIDIIYIAGGGIGIIAAAGAALFFLRRELFFNIVAQIKDFFMNIPSFLASIPRMISKRSFPISRSKSVFSSGHVRKFKRKEGKVKKHKKVKKSKLSSMLGIKNKIKRKIKTKSGKVLANYEAESGKKSKTIFTYNVKKDKKKKDKGFNVV